MIRRLKYKDINFEKYSQCLENSEQRKYCATKDFLDITSHKNWDLLVYNDYEAVMPVPFVVKKGLKFVHNPMLCQQLGVFSEKDSVEINDQFRVFLERKYLVKTYTFNEFNKFSKPIGQRKNYIIEPDLFENVYAKYSPKRKRKIRSEKEILEASEIKNISFKEAESFIAENFIGAHKTKDIPRFIAIFEQFYKKDKVIFKAYYYKNTLANVIVVYTDDKTNALLGTFNAKDFVKLSGASILINETLKENIATKLFDFEGSELPNVEEFFRGFRPELRPFSIIDYTAKQVIRNILSIKSFNKFLFL